MPYFKVDFSGEAIIAVQENVVAPEDRKAHYMVEDGKLLQAYIQADSRTAAILKANELLENVAKANQ